MKYRNPQGTLTEECMSWFVVLFLNVFTFGLFMFVYLIYKKVWQHAIIYLVIAFLVIPIIIYPFYIGSIVRKNYLTNGWLEVSDSSEQLGSNVETRSKVGDYVILAIILALVLTIAAQLLT